MEICIINAAYLSQICLILASYMKQVWLWRRLNDTDVTVPFKWESTCRWCSQHGEVPYRNIFGTFWKWCTVQNVKIVKHYPGDCFALAPAPLPFPSSQIQLENIPWNTKDEHKSSSSKYWDLNGNRSISMLTTFMPMNLLTRRLRPK